MLCPGLCPEMCSGLFGILNEFNWLFQELLFETEESKRCGCKVPSGILNIFCLLGGLISKILGLLGGILGGSKSPYCIINEGVVVAQQNFF
ncbi:hypothetical protein L596_008904 [Steinernema carpocapsae]|uniref:Uncharacterized protein n=1 Tax=Steinernema carpocapsae TaxID=34508 RepID=A0A4U5PEC5_STECR|nr:hypothetical protein L596_008904 [Steinernema carpocapsae]